MWRDRTSGVLPAPLYDGAAARELAPRLTHANGFGANLGEFQRAARGAGFFNPFLGGGGPRAVQIAARLSF